MITFYIKVFLHSDTVVKELLVIPEGFPVEQVFSHMACPKGTGET